MFNPLLPCLVRLDVDLLMAMETEVEEEEAEVATQAGRRPRGEPLPVETDLRTTVGTQAGRSPRENPHDHNDHTPHHRMTLRGAEVVEVAEAAVAEETSSPPWNVTAGTC